MYKHTLSVDGEYLAKDQALPQNASADGNGVVLDLRGTMGGVEIVARAAGAISIADTKSLTLTLQHKADGGAYADLGELFGVTAAGGAWTAASGEILGRFVPDTDVEKNLKVVLSTTDPAASGSVSVLPTYLAR
jgi:hypothetical protein